jgi:hypothetical protein
MRYDGKWYELPRQDGESVAAFLMRLLATAESRAETLSWLTSAGSMPGRPAPPRNDERADGLPPSRRGFQPARQPRATPVVAGRHTFHTACNTTRAASCPRFPPDGDVCVELADPGHRVDDNGDERLAPRDDRQRRAARKGWPTAAVVGSPTTARPRQARSGLS